MRLRTSIFFAILTLACPAIYAQDESSRSIKGGGITAPGWTGKVDAGEEGRANH
jgi:hypothetical protein